MPGVPQMSQMVQMSQRVWLRERFGVCGRADCAVCGDTRLEFTLAAITWVGMTRQHFQPGLPGRVRLIVLHATAGRAPGDLAWLRKGGDERRPVSAHYYISRSGAVSQLVRDEDIAWHAGRSSWRVDGRIVNGCNAVSLGVELENLNSGRDPYPESQYAAAVALVRELVRRHDVPRAQLVRHLDIAPGRKTDPAGFPWPRFVAEVYAEQPADTGDGGQLRALMLDRAYRAAGSALPAGWPLLDAAQALGLGMPVASLHGRPAPRAAGSAQDDRDRAVVVAGERLIVEVYARDLLYAPAADPGEDLPAGDRATRLADTPAGPLREALLELLFRAADPVNGFQPGWAFHRHYLERAARLGVPIGPCHRIALGPRQVVVCQHFALDSLCSPVGAWQIVYSLSDLVREVPGLDVPAAAALRCALRDDLYRIRAGRRYDPAALLSRHAERAGLGAPLGAPEVATAGGAAYLLMPFALDVLACPLPSPDWPADKALPAATAVIALGELAALTPQPPFSRAAPTGEGEPDRPQTFTLAAQDNGAASTLGYDAPSGREPSRPSALSASSAPFAEAAAAPLGPPAQPPLLDLSRYAPARRTRGRPAPDLVLIAAAPGPCAVDLGRDHAAARWHYYVDLGGAIYRLRDEAYVAAEAENEAGDPELPERAVVVAVEGGPADAAPDQRQALAWLVRTLAAGLGLGPRQVCALGPHRARDAHSGANAVQGG